MKVVCSNCKDQHETGSNKTGRRKCYECKKQIGRHDKWFFRKDGRAQHRYCSNPINYTNSQVK